MSCCPHPPECCCYPSCGPCGQCGPCSDCCNIRRNRSCCDCFPGRLSQHLPISTDLRRKVKTSRQPPSISPSKRPSTKRTYNLRPSTGSRKTVDDEGGMINGGSSTFTSSDGGNGFVKIPTPTPTQKNSPRNSIDIKQTKNKQNFQYQDMKKRMEVIDEEVENESDDDECCCNKKIQDSCADFLSIVHDTVLETVQSSVETMLRNYYVHTMDRIETLCSQMMRNECLLSKMYLDVLEKLAQQGEKGTRQFKCLCHFVADIEKTMRNRTSRDRSPCERNTCGGERNTCGGERNTCGGERNTCGGERNTCGGERNTCGGERNTCERERNTCDRTARDRTPRKVDSGECSCNAEEAYMHMARERTSSRSREPRMCTARERASSVSRCHRVHRASAGRDSDAELRTDASMTSYSTVPKLQAKMKSRDLETNNTNLSDEGRTRRRPVDYTETRRKTAGEKAESARRTTEPVRPSDAYRILNNCNMSDGRFGSMNNGRNEAEMVGKKQ